MRASSLTNLGVASDYYIDSDYDKVLQVAAVTQEIQQLAPYADAVGVVADDISSVTSVAQAIEDGIVGVFKVDDRVKLDGIEAGATADQTGAEIKTLYEAQTNTNAYTDTEKVNASTAYAHVSNINNPHSVTKAQVGLGSVDNTSDVNKPVSTAAQVALNLKANLASPTFTGTVSGITKAMVGLGSVDNTADSAKVVASAAKLTTARTIGGVSFDGTANINLPGVNTAGNQSTTGNAATATKLQTARTINGVAFDGSTNIVLPSSANNKRKNYLINGNFQFWDYATSQTADGYGSDNRWHNSNLYSTKTHSRIDSGATERALFESPYYSRTVVSSVAGAVSSVVKRQGIEDITKLAGKTVTLSFWAKADSTKNIAVSIHQIFGTGGSQSAEVSSHVSTISLTTTWKRYTVTVNMPSIVGKTLGIDGVHTSCTFLQFWFDAGYIYNSITNNLGQQSGTFDIAEVKLEDGSVATDGWAPYDGEWGSEAIARMRYYEVGTAYGLSYASSATAYQRFMINYKVIKRVIPSISLIKTSGIASGGTPSVINDDNCVVAFTAAASSQEWFGTFTSAAEL